MIRGTDFGKIPLHIKAHVKSLNGKIRIFFSQKEKKGWYAYVNKPLLKIDIDPVIGNKNKIYLGVFPKVRKLHLRKASAEAQ